MCSNLRKVVKIFKQNHNTQAEETSKDEEKHLLNYEKKEIKIKNVFKAYCIVIFKS
jgi:uncharacterized protein YeaC (DUF1315 family)